jgi:hypothetical protein
MIKLDKLFTYTKQLRTNARSGTVELQCLDTKRDNPMMEIPIPVNGYILKCGEIYLVEPSKDLKDRSEDDFSQDLVKLGVTVKIVDDTTCLLTVQRPIRIYSDTDLFYDD